MAKLPNVKVSLVTTVPVRVNLGTKSEVVQLAGVPRAGDRITDVLGHALLVVDEVTWRTDGLADEVAAVLTRPWGVLFYKEPEGEGETDE